MGALSSPPLRIAPDTYSRNWWIARACEAVFLPGEHPTALDVGGCGGMTNEFLRNVRVVDLRAGADVDVVADACWLPFSDRAFDVVCCSDVLEQCRRPTARRCSGSCSASRAGSSWWPALSLARGRARRAGAARVPPLLHQRDLAPLARRAHALRAAVAGWLEDELARTGRAYHRLGSNDVNNWLLFQLLMFLNMFDLDAQVGDFFEDYNRNLNAYRDAARVRTGTSTWSRSRTSAPRRDRARCARARNVVSGTGNGDGQRVPLMPPPVLVAKAFSAVAEAMAVKNARTEAAVASAARNAVLLGEPPPLPGHLPRGSELLSHEEALARCAELDERLRLAHETLDAHESFIHQQHRQLAEVARARFVLRSKSWKLTAPLRTMIDSARSLSDVSRRIAGRDPLRRAPGDRPARCTRRCSS